MVFGSARRDIEILAIIVGVVIVLIIWSGVRALDKLFKSPSKALPEVNLGIPEADNSHMIEDNAYFLPRGDDGMAADEDDFRSKDEARRPNFRDAQWLDSWQTKIHRPSVFSKSIMAIILPQINEVETTRDEMSIRSPIVPLDIEEGDCDKEMLVVPANMASGMCDHNLALGTFLWSPSKHGSTSLKEETRSRPVAEDPIIQRRSTEDEYVSPRSPQLNTRTHIPINHHHHHTHWPIESNHDHLHPHSPFSAPASEVVSRLSSVKSSSSHKIGTLHTLHENCCHDIRGHHSHSHSIVSSSPISSSSSASALSPPPPSAASLSLLNSSISGNLEHRIGRTYEIKKEYTYPLRYKSLSQAQTQTQEEEKQHLYEDYGSQSPRLNNHNMAMSLSSTPTTHDIHSPTSSVSKHRHQGDSAQEQYHINPFDLPFNIEQERNRARY